MNREIKLKPCPFCKSEDIRYSIKTTTISFTRAYHASMYCFKCNAYGSRILTKNQYNTRRDVENDTELKQQAIRAWNNRAEVQNDL